MTSDNNIKILEIEELLKSKNKLISEIKIKKRFILEETAHTSSVPIKLIVYSNQGRVAKISWTVKKIIVTCLKKVNCFQREKRKIRK